MAVKHRKLLPDQDSNQTADCSDCGPTCPYDCAYPEFYWPPESPPLPPQPTTNHDSTGSHLAPYVIIIVTLIGSAFLFISYYLIMVRYYARFRRSPATQINGEEEDLFDEDHGPEVDHPIWYITTSGLQPAVINSITVVKFKKGDSLIEGTDCSVCLSEFQDDETLRLLPKCNHAFHIPCIDTWLRSHTNCPLCRAGILSTTALISNEQDTRIENQENEGDLDGNQENGGETGEGVEIGEDEDEGKETEDQKTESEAVLAKSRLLSMDLATEIIVADSEGCSIGSTADLQSSNNGGDSRTRRMMSGGSSVDQSVQN